MAIILGGLLLLLIIAAIFWPKTQARKILVLLVLMFALWHYELIPLAVLCLVMWALVGGPNS